MRLGLYPLCKLKSYYFVMALQFNDVLPQFCQKLDFNSLTRFTGSRHDGFIVLCATQIVKGYQGSKGERRTGWTNFDLIRSCSPGVKSDVDGEKSRIYI